MVNLFSGNLPYIITICYSCVHSYDLIIIQWMKQDSLARLFSCVLLNSDSAFGMKKQQFEISPTDSARRKLENLQNSLILKTLLNFIVNIWIYMSCLFEQWFFFSHLTVLSSYSPYWFRKRWELTPCTEEGERWEKFSVMHIKNRKSLYIYICISFCREGESWRKAYTKY